MISVIEMFSGIGAFRKALERQAVEHEVIGISEIDKYAIQSYNAIFGQTKNYGDISKVLKLDYADMWTYGFPCQDISVAGKQAGIKRDTRSGLLYQVQRLLETAYQYNELPKYLIMENVKNLVGKKFRKDFDSWLDYLDEIGYNNYWQVLNAKDYGIPQNRERVFCISIRKDIDKGEFKFPEKQELRLRLKNVLEDEVEDKYYLSDVQVERMKTTNFECSKFEHRVTDENGITPTLCARDYKDPKCVRIGGVFDTDTQKHQAGSVWDTEGLSPTLDTMQGGWRQPCIIDSSVKPSVAKNFEREKAQIATTDKEIYGAKCTSGFSDNKIGIKVSPTIRASSSSIYGMTKNFVVRKLTPKECWRLMGFDDSDFDKAQASGVSNTQLYKQAGNSIVVNVLEEIIKNLGLPTHF